MGPGIHLRAARGLAAVSLVAILACGAPAATSSPAPAPTASPEATKPFAVAQPQLPLPTAVRWAVDRGSPDDPQQRGLLVLFYDGNAQGWRIVDASGSELFRVPIAGSGIFGPETCVVKARRANEIATWIGLDRGMLDRFAQQYRTYRAIAEGIPVGSATLELVDSGCRAT